uniref:C-type lectin domain-containing protein n=1 Tax=Labrus bergylta TaxID=56723 RepID=A0A3Q3LVD9_9LABR
MCRELLRGREAETVDASRISFLAAFLPRDLLSFMTGLFFLPVCFPRRYILVREALNWTEAQRYCREKFIDLASVSSEQESERLREATEEHDEDHLWIGLYDDIDSWRWSLEEEGYYGEGEAEFRKWGGLEPNNFRGVSGFRGYTLEKLRCEHVVDREVSGTGFIQYRILHV